MSENNPKPTITTTPKGLATALTAFLIWGNFPLYFKKLNEYHSLEIIVHRILWTFVLLLMVLAMGRRTAWLKVIKAQPKWLALTFVSAILIAINWLVYVWAVTHNQVLEASLGYFLLPLVGVGLSLILLKEKLRPLQKIAVVLALLAGVVQIFWSGGLSWVSVLLPLSFAFYGIIQRQTPLDAIDGLFLETALLLPFGLIWLVQADVASANLAFWSSNQVWLLALAGPITLVPLLLYNQATKQVAFNTLSFLNYLTPSIVFGLAVFYYQEALDVKKLMVFVCIWIGLALYSIDMIRKKS